MLKDLPDTGLTKPTAAATESQDPTGTDGNKVGYDRYNSDGSGSTITTNPDGTKTSADFDRLNGAVKLAGIFGTLPEVVAAHPELFALRYMSMANQQTAQPKNLVPLAGDQAVGSDAPEADTRSDIPSDGLSPAAAGAAGWTDRTRQARA